IIGAILGVIYQKTLSIEDSTWFSKYASAFLVGDRVGGGFSPEVTSIEQGFEDFDLTHEEIEAFVADQQRASRKTLDAEMIASAARLDANARERLREDMSRRIVDLGEGGSEGVIPLRSCTTRCRLDRGRMTPQRWFSAGRQMSPKTAAGVVIGVSRPSTRSST